MIGIFRTDSNVSSTCSDTVTLVRSYTAVAVMSTVRAPLPSHSLSTISIVDIHGGSGGIPSVMAA